MGKHNVDKPKKVSFLGSSGGLFGTLLLAGTIFVASVVSGDSPFNNPDQHISKGDKGMQPIRPGDGNDDGNSDGIANTGSSNSIVSAALVGVPQVTAPRGSVRPPNKPGGSQQPPGQSSNPGLPEVPLRPDVEIHASVHAPPILGLDADVQARLGLLSIAEPVTDPATETLNNILK